MQQCIQGGRRCLRDWKSLIGKNMYINSPRRSSAIGLFSSRYECFSCRFGVRVLRAITRQCVKCISSRTAPGEHRRCRVVKRVSFCYRRKRDKFFQN